MKKRVLAISLAASLPSQAFSAPELYGKMHLSVDKVTDFPTSLIGDTLSDATSASLPDQWQVESNSSRLGIRGVDPLYSRDLKAIYQVEVGVDADGDGSATFSTRNTYLGLDTPAGKFFAGRYDSVVKQAELKQDQFNDTVGDISNLFLTQNRNSNTLNWVSPAFGVLTVKAQLAPGEGDADANDTKDGLADTLGLSVAFSQDELIGALAFESSYFDSTTFGSLVDVDALRGTLGVNLDGGVQLGAIVEMVSLEPSGGGGDADVLSWVVSGKLGVSDRLDLKAQGGMLDSSDLDSEIMIVSAGADYKLGKTTTVYGILSLSDAEIDLLPVDESGNALSFGMVHSF